MTVSASPLTDLIEMAKDPARRPILMDRLAGIFTAEPDRFDGASRRLLGDVLTRLCVATGPDARRALAERMADTPQAPAALMRHLAFEPTEISAPVLMRSAALSNAALLELAKDADETRLALLAARAKCPPALSQAITDHGRKAALKTLAGNENAQLTQSVTEALIGAARHSAALRETLIERLDLPPFALTRLYFLSDGAGRKAILLRANNIEPALAGGAAAANRKAALTGGGESDKLASARAHVRQAVRASAAHGRLLEELIHKNQSASFLVAFAYYTGVDIAAAKTILKDRHGEAQAIACRSADLPRPMFAKILFLKLKSPEGDADAARMLDLYLKIPRDAADKMMRFWRVGRRPGKTSGGNTAPVEALLRAAS